LIVDNSINKDFNNIILLISIRILLIVERISIRILFLINSVP